VAFDDGSSNVRFAPVTEAGWYNDERDPALARWFDGQAWTEHTLVKAEWAGLGTPPSPVGEPPLRPYRPIPDPPRLPMPGGAWIVLVAVVLLIVVALVLVR
jgi:hypothetical protein